MAAHGPSCNWTVTKRILEAQLAAYKNCPYKDTLASLCNYMYHIVPLDLK